MKKIILAIAVALLVSCEFAVEPAPSSTTTTIVSNDTRWYQCSKLKAGYITYFDSLFVSTSNKKSCNGVKINTNTMQFVYLIDNVWTIGESPIEWYVLKPGE